MKKIIILSITALCLSFAANAQKIGHINVKEVMALMPEYKDASKQIQEMGEAYTKQIEALEKEYQQKITDYSNNVKNMTGAVKEVKENELNELGQRIQMKRQEAQEKITTKEAELLEPILTKMTNAIKAVATEGNFDYILETGSIHFAKESLAVGNQVKAKLGIK